MRFVIPEALAQSIRSHKDFQSLDGFGEAVLLDPGLGPTIYLTMDGRVVMSGWTDDEGLREAGDDDATSALVVGALKTGMAGLLDLIPVKPESGRSCGGCGGSRWMSLPGVDVVCPRCHGLGWTKAETGRQD